jgi:hypothetical protein
MLMILLVVLPLAAGADEISRPHAFAVYTGRISAEETWHEVLIKPYSDNYADSYLVTGAYSYAWRETREGALRWESEANLTYNFGQQDHWEVNVSPLTLRWQRFPWSERFSSSIAFGAGFSYAFDFPQVEYELENDTQQFLVFWLLELTAGPVDGPWSVLLRLHHRSPAWGAMGVSDGGMNAPSLGFRYQF